MFVPVTKTERQDFLSQHNTSFIPGYTGHCPTLRFHYGRCYGAKTREIIQDLRDQGVLREALRQRYRENDPGKAVLEPIVTTKGQTRDYALCSKYRAPRFMIGYTGFIPTLNFRYGKSYGRAADDCMYEFESDQRKLHQVETEAQNILRTRSAPKLVPIRGKDEVMQELKPLEDTYKYIGHEISENCPPIAGYTGHIPRVTGNEESLSQRYNTVVKRGFSILNEDRRKRNELSTAQKEITSILRKTQDRHTYKEI